MNQYPLFDEGLFLSSLPQLKKPRINVLGVMSLLYEIHLTI